MEVIPTPERPRATWRQEAVLEADTLDAHTAQPHGGHDPAKAYAKRVVAAPASPRESLESSQRTVASRRHAASFSALSHGLRQEHKLPQTPRRLKGVLDRLRLVDDPPSQPPSPSSPQDRSANAMSAHESSQDDADLQTMTSHKSRDQGDEEHGDVTSAADVRVDVAGEDASPLASPASVEPTDSWRHLLGDWFSRAGIEKLAEKQTAQHSSNGTTGAMLAGSEAIHLEEQSNGHLSRCDSGKSASTSWSVEMDIHSAHAHALKRLDGMRHMDNGTDEQQEHWVHSPSAPTYLSMQSALHRARERANSPPPLWEAMSPLRARTQSVPSNLNAAEIDLKRQNAELNGMVTTLDELVQKLWLRVLSLEDQVRDLGAEPVLAEQAALTHICGVPVDELTGLPDFHGVFAVKHVDERKKRHSKSLKRWTRLKSATWLHARASHRASDVERAIARHSGSATTSHRASDVERAIARHSGSVTSQSSVTAAFTPVDSPPSTHRMSSQDRTPADSPEASIELTAFKPQGLEVLEHSVRHTTRTRSRGKHAIFKGFTTPQQERGSLDDSPSDAEEASALKQRMWQRLRQAKDAPGPPSLMQQLRRALSGLHSKHKECATNSTPAGERL